MPVDLDEFFKQYEALVKSADQVFDQVRRQYPTCVQCMPGCSDCCHALFDLTLIEALYINRRFHEMFDGREPEKQRLLDRANIADRQTYKIKRSAYKSMEKGVPEKDILENLAKVKVRCALLEDDMRCAMYPYRPITCRFYGIPTAIAGKGYTCGKSAFIKGAPYPTVNLDAVHQKLYQISDVLVKAIKSKHIRMGSILVPLSMALLTVYDDDYLGLMEEKKGDGVDGSILS